MAWWRRRRSFSECSESEAKCEKELQHTKSGALLKDPSSFRGPSRTRRTKTLLFEKLSSTVEERGGEIQALSYELEALRSSLAAAKEELLEAEGLRRKEEAQSLATVREARQAQVAVARAQEAGRWAAGWGWQVLENVYVKASLLQEGSDLAAEMEQVLGASRL